MKKQKIVTPFAAIPRCILADPRIRSPELLTFIILVSMTNANSQQRVAWPSQSTLGKYQQKKRGAINNHLKRLVALGMIVPVDPNGEYKGQAKWQSVCYEMADPFKIYGHMCFWTWKEWQEHLAKISVQDIEQDNIFLDESGQKYVHQYVHKNGHKEESYKKKEIIKGFEILSNKNESMENLLLDSFSIS